MHKYTTGEKIELLDHVLIGMFGMEFPGKVVYIEGECQIVEYDWCTEKILKGILVEWDSPEETKYYLGCNDEVRNTITDFIQLSSWDDEDLIFVSRCKKTS